MKTLSIIGIVLFSLLLILDLGACNDIGPTLDGLDTIGQFASLLDSGEELTDFTDSIYMLIGLVFIGSLYGLIFSIKALSSCKKQRSGDKMHRLLQLGKLKEQGVLSDDEFEARKREIMAGY